MAPLEDSPFPPDAGFGFVGMSNIHHDIYPAIDVSKTTNLQQPGKVILITGAGRGLGRAMAIQYARANVNTIILSARTSSELDEVETRIKEVNGAVTVRKEVLNVTDGAAVKDLAHRIEQDVDRLDVLINNAGLSRSWEPILDTDPEDYWEVMEVNLHGPLLFTHAFLPLLARTAEKHSTHVDILNIAAIVAVLLFPGSSSYGIAKLALLKLSEYIALEYGNKGINVMSIHPGSVLTKLSSAIKEIQPFLVDTAELCGGFVVWLSSQDRTWLNGRYLAATWDVDALEAKKEEIVGGDKLKVKMVV